MGAGTRLCQDLRPKTSSAGGFEAAVSRGSALSMIAGSPTRRRRRGRTPRSAPRSGRASVPRTRAGARRRGLGRFRPRWRGRARAGRARSPTSAPQGVDQHRVVRLGALGGVYRSVLGLEAVLTRRSVQAATVEPRPAAALGRRVRHVDVPAAHHEHGDGVRPPRPPVSRLVFRYPVCEGGLHGRRCRRRRRPELGREEGRRGGSPR